MNIQEFSRQLGREEQPSKLIQALRTLRDLDADQIRWAGDWGTWTEDEPHAGQVVRAGWYPWPDFEPDASSRRPELRS